MAVMQNRIVPHLWYDKEAREAAEFYCSVFPDSSITNVTTLHDTPSGDTEIVSFVLDHHTRRWLRWLREIKALAVVSRRDIAPT